MERIATRIEQGYQRWSCPNITIEDETLDEEKTKYLFEKKENNINDDTTDDDLGKIEEIMRNSRDTEE